VIQDSLEDTFPSFHCKWRCCYGIPQDGFPKQAAADILFDVCRFTDTASGRSGFVKLLPSQLSQVIINENSNRNPSLVLFSFVDHNGLILFQSVRKGVRNAILVVRRKLRTFDWRAAGSPAPHLRLSRPLVPAGPANAAQTTKPYLGVLRVFQYIAVVT
jgi:hypothetical protein